LLAVGVVFALRSVLRGAVVFVGRSVGRLAVGEEVSEEEQYGQQAMSLRTLRET